MSYQRPSSRPSNTPAPGALLEILVVWLVLKLVVKAYFATSWVDLEVDLLRWTYSAQILTLAAALVLIARSRRGRRAFGLVPNWPADLRLGVGLALLFIAVPLAAMALFSRLTLVEPTVGYVLSTMIFQFFLSGIGEEIFYRGYIQSRLNHAWGRPWQVGGIRFGAGLIVTSLLFGFAHVLSGFNPFVGSYHLDLFAGIVTAIWGLLYGLMREKTGSVFGAGILHGHEAVTALFVMTSPGQIAYAVGLLIAFGTLLGAPALWASGDPREALLPEA